MINDGASSVATANGYGVELAEEPLDQRVQQKTFPSAQRGEN